MKINSIFESISGEAGPVISQGAWTTFIRTQGCCLVCDYCDTPESQDPDGGLEMGFEEILSLCQTRNILITGGEPLLQEDMPDLITTLLCSGHTVQIETNGMVHPGEILKASFQSYISTRLGFVIDVKGPSSGHRLSHSNFFSMWSDRLLMTGNNDLKFVFMTEEDLSFYFEFIAELEDQFETVQFMGGPRYVFSPVIQGRIGSSSIRMASLRHWLSSQTKKSLMDRILISLQIHKILGMD